MNLQCSKCDWWCHNILRRPFLVQNRSEVLTGGLVSVVVPSFFPTEEPQRVGIYVQTVLTEAMVTSLTSKALLSPPLGPSVFWSSGTTWTASQLERCRYGETRCYTGSVQRLLGTEYLFSHQHFRYFWSMKTTHVRFGHRPVTRATSGGGEKCFWDCYTIFRFAQHTRAATSNSRVNTGYFLWE